jgi:hypothetical protein
MVIRGAFLEDIGVGIEHGRSPYQAKLPSWKNP